MPSCRHLRLTQVIDRIWDRNSMTAACMSTAAFSQTRLSQYARNEQQTQGDCATEQVAFAETFTPKVVRERDDCHGQEYGLQPV